MSDRGVCRTALASPGLLNTREEEEHSASDLITTLFIEQSLALPGSVKH